MLLEEGRPVRLGGRAMDLLLLLVARAGEIVSKAELMAAAWPDTHVEEANLRVHIGALRKALGDRNVDARFIENVAGRGYCFVAPLTPGAEAAAVRAEAKAAEPAQQIFGRDATIASLCREMPQRRLVSIVGPGGIGKTTVALAAAQAMAASYPDGIALVDLASVSDAGLIVSVMARALGLPGRADPSVTDIADLLRGKRLLIVLDSCEHLVEAAAALAERLSQNLPGLHLLATSREPLRIKGEWVERLPPLGLPPATTPAIGAAEALAFPSVQLFVERAAACLGGYTLADADAPVVTEICRRLDGIALAIELAAGRIDTLGLRGLAASLKDSFEVLTRGRRTALARHQTMRATLDWSYGVLSPAEQTLFRRLAVFNGGFSLEAAHAVAGDETSSPSSSHAALDEALANLVAKSLVTASFAGEAASYRLLETTRAYAFEQLAASGEADRIAARHADHYRGIFERAEAEWEARPANEWLDDYAAHLDNLRAALDWAFSGTGDGALAVALTATAVPLWFQLSLVDECLGRVARALATLDRLPTQEPRRRMQLQSALGWPQMRAIAGLASGAAAWRETLRLAEEIGDRDYQQRALWALWVDRTNSGAPREALALAERFAGLAKEMRAPSEERIGDRMCARSLHLLGDLAGARQHVDRMLDRYVAPAQRSHVARFQYDQRLVARITLARVLWLQGLADQALREIADTVEQAASVHHTLTLAHVLSDAACPVALMAGDLALAERYTAMLHEQTRTHSLDVWKTYADGFAGEIRIRRGEVAAGLDGLRGAIDTLAEAGFVLYQTAFLASLAHGLMAAGQRTGARDAIDQAIGQCARTGEAWLLAELHRLRGEATGDDASFATALEIARAQGALAWELRAATSLARRSPEGRRVLTSILAKVTEGFGLPDYRAAKELVGK